MTGPTLKGMTWSHPRGFDPMVACSAQYQAKTKVRIDWDKRSLQDFESYPVEELARRYDLIVIDHPHVGQVTSEGCLAPLDVPGRESAGAALAAASVGPSYPSYLWRGRQWALPIDAATQVQAWRPDVLPAAPARWEDVTVLAAEGRVLVPLRPPHSLMVLYTLAGNLGRPCATEGPGDLIDRAFGAVVIDRIKALFRLIDRQCLEMDPIAVFERMAERGSTVACAPLIYGYASYALAGFRPTRIAFADIPVAGRNGPIGSALGGTGIAVSAFSREREAAIDFAYWVASGAVQKGPYAAAGGQPGNAEAWEDAAVNAAAGNFYRATRATLEGSWLRPRHDGYMEFQQMAADRLNAGLVDDGEAGTVVDDLNRLYRQSFARPIAAEGEDA